MKTQSWSVRTETEHRFNSVTGEPIVRGKRWIMNGDRHLALMCDWSKPEIDPAPLFAAAPEMLEALKEIWKAMDREDHVGLIAVVKVWAEDAISLAEGRSG